MSLIELQTGWDELRLEAPEGGPSPSFSSIPFPSSIYLSVEWNSSSVVRTRHMISIQAGESGRCITGSEWTTSCWPDQGRKTHVLLVLAGWLPAERVGNSCSRRDEGMETWTTWRRRRRKSVSMCLLCPNINLEMMLEYCPSVKHGKSVLLEWLHDFGTGTLNLLGEQCVNVLTSETIED